jgi:DNA repair protein RadC
MNQLYLKKKPLRLKKHIGDNISSPRCIAEILLQLLGEDEAKEHFYVFHLDCKMRILGFEEIGIGNYREVHVYISEIFRGALISGAVKIIVAHNHPSGCPLPSGQDDGVWTKISNAGKVIDFEVLDQVIVSGKKFHSKKEGTSYDL